MYPGSGFAGRYHHWDGYPSGLGATLYELAQGPSPFPTVDDMLRVLIDEHPSGWSTINGADWTLPIGYVNEHRGPCAVCAEPMESHYCQYYPPQPGRAQGHEPGSVEGCHGGPSSYQHMDHPWERIRQAHPAMCYCHGERSEPAGDLLTHEDAAGSGCEWAYVLSPLTLTMTILRAKDRDGRAMVGMFGAGDPWSTWSLVTIVDLASPAPDWDRLDRGEPVCPHGVPDAAWTAIVSHA